jgi:VWFA-related protein
VRVRLVQLNFIAVDRKGRAVTDLRADEIEIVDRGAVQRLAFLERYVQRDATAGEPEVGAARRPTGEAVAEPSTPAPPRRWLVLFFDNYASAPWTRTHAIEAAREHVASELGPGDQAAIVSFDGELHVLASFTDDPAEIDAALALALGQAHRASGDRHADLDQLVDDLERCLPLGVQAYTCASQRGASYEHERRVEAQVLLQALTQTLASLASIPDAKMLVLFGNGFLRTPAADVYDATRATLGETVADRVIVGQDFRVDLELDRLATAAARAKVAIFAVNPATHSSTVTAERGAVPNTAINAFQVDVYERSGRNSHESLDELARRTGGKALRTPHVREALDEIMDLGDGLYTVGYYPDTRSAKHDVKVRVRRRGVRAIHAREVPADAGQPPLRGDLSVAADTCGDAGRRVVKVRVRIDVSSLMFEGLGGRFHNNFSLYVQLLEGDGTELLYQRYRFLNLDYSAAEYGKGELRDPEIEQTLVAPCRPLLVKATVVDALTGARADFDRALTR